MIVVDTGVLFGAADRDDPHHVDCSTVLEAHAGEIAVPVPVLVEATWLIESRVGPAAEAAFLRAVNRGEIDRIDLTERDWDRVVQLIETYRDMSRNLSSSLRRGLSRSSVCRSRSSAC